MSLLLLLPASQRTKAGILYWSLNEEGDTRMFKNVASQKITLVAIDTVNNVPKVGDADSITGYIKKDGGAVTQLGSPTPTEDDPTNAPGSYTFTLTQGETDANWLELSGKSSTEGVRILPKTVWTQPNHFADMAIDENDGGVHVFHMQASALQDFFTDTGKTWDDDAVPGSVIYETARHTTVIDLTDQALAGIGEQITGDHGDGSYLTATQTEDLTIRIQAAAAYNATNANTITVAAHMERNGQAIPVTSMTAKIYDQTDAEKKDLGTAQKGTRDVYRWTGTGCTWVVAGAVYYIIVTAVHDGNTYISPPSYINT